MQKNHQKFFFLKKCGSLTMACLVCIYIHILMLVEMVMGNLFYDGLPVCHDYWNDIDAIVFCSSIGFKIVNNFKG